MKSLYSGSHLKFPIFHKQTRSPVTSYSKAYISRDNSVREVGPFLWRAAEYVLRRHVDYSTLDGSAFSNIFHLSWFPRPLPSERGLSCLLHSYSKMSEHRRRLARIAFKPCLRVHQEEYSEKSREIKLSWIHQLLLYDDDVNLPGANINTIRKTPMCCHVPGKYSYLEAYG
jgi:hypothetical protein